MEKWNGTGSSGPKNLTTSNGKAQWYVVVHVVDSVSPLSLRVPLSATLPNVGAISDRD